MVPFWMASWNAFRNYLYVTQYSADIICILSSLTEMRFSTFQCLLNHFSQARETGDFDMVNLHLSMQAYSREPYSVHISTYI